jgi:hypothetical protein
MVNLLLIVFDHIPHIFNPCGLMNPKNKQLKNLKNIKRNLEYNYKYKLMAKFSSGLFFPDLLIILEAEILLKFAKTCIFLYL